MELPTGKAEPLAGPEVWVAVKLPLQLSLGTGLAKVTTAEQLPASLLTEREAGQVKSGASLSLTVTLNRQVSERPLEETAKDSSVRPKGKKLPEAGPLNCAVTDPAQLSLPTGAL